MKTYCRKTRLNRRYLNRQKQEKRERGCGWTLVLQLALVVSTVPCISYHSNRFIIVCTTIHLNMKEVEVVVYLKLNSRKEAHTRRNA
jgi:hypothetical protein